MIEEHLARADRNVAQSEQRIVQQRTLVEGLKQGGHNTDMAQELLRSFDLTTNYRWQSEIACRRSFGSSRRPRKAAHGTALRPH